MPSGRVQWFDPGSGEGIVIRGGRQYPVAGDDIERDAAVPGAPVHFDVLRRGPVRRAVNVTLRRGTRVSRRQGRFGDLGGARRPDAVERPSTRRRPGRERRYPGRPSDVVAEWVELAAAGDWANVALLYAPDADLHHEEGTDRGRAVIVERLADLGVGKQGPFRVTGTDSGSFEAVAETVLVRMRVEHGFIAEQWVAQAPKTS